MGKQKELNISKSLTSLMELHKVSVKELAYKSGVPQKTIYHLLSGRVGDVHTVEKLADAFKVSLHFIFFGSPDPREANGFSFEDLLSGHFEIVVRKRTQPSNKE